jgi:hypothetical protein
VLCIYKMEIAIPLVALGGLYISSNSGKDKYNNRGQINQQKMTKEGFENMGRNENDLPNMNLPADNYPVQSGNLGPDQVRMYYDGRAVTDQYYNQTAYMREADKGVRVGNEIKQIYSLTGDPIDKSEFKHNNMVPFFGGKMRGVTSDSNSNESRLDSMQGIGSQHFKKQEITPMFAPQEMMQFPHGMPNNSDFYQSRMNPSNRMANVKPWEEQMVAPGLGKGYGSQGSGGFNSGMESRDSWLPRTVNELRVATNPKVTYSLANHEGPAASEVKNLGILGRVEKNRPDTDYEWGPARFFTTTGIEHAPTSRGIEVLQQQHRESTTTSYFGTAGAGSDNKATYTQGKFEPAKKSQLGAVNMGSAAAAGQGGATSGDYGVQGYKLLPNNRATANTEIMGNVGGLFKAAVAPILDVLRPTRKENVVGNARPSGNVGVTAPSAPAYNPADRLRTTIREMTGGKLDNNHLNVQNQREGAYSVSKQTPINNQRDTTSVYYSGNAGGGATRTGMRSVHSVQNQRNNVNKTYENRPNQGGMQTFNHTENIQVNRLDGDRNNNRWGVASGGPTVIPSMETHGRIHGSQMTFAEDNRHQMDRINPDLLMAFKSNPYTKPLDSWA